MLDLTRRWFCTGCARCFDGTVGEARDFPIFR